jgi:hypothetical protein
VWSALLWSRTDDGRFELAAGYVKPVGFHPTIKKPRAFAFLGVFWLLMVVGYWVLILMSWLLSLGKAGSIAL